MQISQVIEKEDGSDAAITGTLSGQELAVVVTLGLNLLYAQGLVEQLTPSLEVHEEVEYVHDIPSEVQ